MAAEVTINLSLSYADANGVRRELAVRGFLGSPTDLKPSHLTQTVHTTETVLKLGDTTTPGWVLLVNRDEDNFVSVKCAASGTIFGKLLPGGGPLLVYLGSGAQAPVAVADTDDCEVELLVIPM